MSLDDHGKTYADGYREGQEAMREACAIIIETLRCEFSGKRLLGRWVRRILFMASEKCLALPIEEPKA